MRIPATIADVCDAETSALIVYDMQAGVVRQLKDGAEIVARVAQLLAAARAAGMRVYFTRHRWLPNRYAGAGQFRRAMIWQQKDDPNDTKPMFEPGSDAWQIVPELAPLADEVVIEKIAMSCFEGTFLNTALRDAGVSSFMIAGIALEIGIEPSIRHALDLNYVPLLVTDACGAATEDARTRSLASLDYSGEVISADLAAVLPHLRAR